MSEDQLFSNNEEGRYRSNESLLPVDPRTIRHYPGGFTSSVSHLFHDSRDRTGCRGLACCGVLSSDRTHYLLTKERPPNWCARLCLNLVTPLLLLYIGITGISFIKQKEDPNSSNNNDDVSNFKYNSYYYPQNNTNTTQKSSLKHLFLVFFLFFLILLLVRAAKRRRVTRMTLMTLMSRLYEDQHDGNVDQAELMRFIQSKSYHTTRLHPCCCSCYQYDFEYLPDHVPEDEPVHDFCTCLWQVCLKACCGVCCRCWLQCFGCCAIAQEEREINRLISKAERLIDYITFEPYSTYFPALERLRLTQNKSFFAHFRAISQLSKKLLKLLLGFIVFCFFIAMCKSIWALFTGLKNTFTTASVLVILATFGQAFIILFFVHWYWNRFDLSFDAVVKYFACGFLISTVLALVIEIIIQLFFNFFSICVVGFIVIRKFDISSVISSAVTDPEKIIFDWIKDHKGLFIFGMFVQSFVIAALVEELCKYFGYWMVEHPDFLPFEDVEEVVGASMFNPQSSSGENDATAASLDLPQTGDEVTPRKSLKSLGAAVTIAMVSAAVGFACCENLNYIFLGKSPSLGQEVTTLVARSLVPVHPLCAAIQSIGICRRDIERDSSCRLGRAILPAVLLHGSFDFVLMVVSFLILLNHPPSEYNPFIDSNSNDADLADAELILLALTISLSLVVTGAVYYFCAARAQRARLIAIELTI